MLKWGFAFFALAVASGLIGASVHDAWAFALVQVMFFGSVVLFVVFTLLGAVLPRSADIHGIDRFPRRDD